MTVKELINILSNFPSDAEIKTEVDDFSYEVVGAGLYYYGDNELKAFIDVI